MVMTLGVFAGRTVAPLPEFVGRQSGAGPGTTTPIVINYGLNGGIGSVPAAGDVVVLTVSIGFAGGQRSFDLSSQGFAEITDLVVEGRWRVNTYVGYKVMGSSPDAGINIGDTGENRNGYAYALHVWRNINASPVLDVAKVEGSQDDNSIPTHSITPVTDNAVCIFVAGGANREGGATAFANASLSNLTAGASAAADINAFSGMGSITWSNSGAVSSGTWTNGPNDANDSSVAWCAIALRPSTL